MKMRILYEVKNGPSAGFTDHQKIAYPKMMDSPRAPIIPRGGNAAKVWGTEAVGQPTTNYILVIKRYY